MRETIVHEKIMLDREEILVDRCLTFKGQFI